MAKNKNQHRRREQQDEPRDTVMQAQEHARSVMAEDPVIAAGSQAARRRQKRFGHN